MPDGKFRDNMLTIKLVIPVTSVADPLSCTLPQAPVLEGAGHHYCEGEHGYKQTNKQADGHSNNPPSPPLLLKN